MVRRKLIPQSGLIIAGNGLDHETVQGLLLLAAMAPCDEHDRFAAEDLRECAPGHLAGINTQAAARLIARLADTRGAPLQMHHTAQGTRFSFVQPALAHLLLLLHEAGLDWARREHFAHA